jgi:ribosome-binding factor A
MKFTPELTFEEDEGMANVERVDQILHTLNTEGEDAPG